MKKLSKFVYAILLVLVSVFFVHGLGLNVPSQKSTSAVDMPASDIFNFVSISQENQVISPSNITLSEDGLTAYITAKNAVTINFLPLQYNYTFKIGGETSQNLEDHFFISWSDEIQLEGDNGTFTYNGEEYNFTVTTTSHYLQILSQATAGTTPTPSASSQHSALLNFNYDTHTLKIAESLVLKKTENLDLTISIVSMSYGSSYSNSYHLVFLQPIQNFDTDKFISYKLFDGTESEGSVVPAIKNDTVFHKLQFSITNNDYTEQNPLYINVNYNGFIYNFVMFSKDLDGTKYICVEYMDQQYPSSLATKFNYDEDTGEYSLDETSAVYPAIVGDKVNEFVFEFTETGRYELEIYDNTHTYGLTNENYYTSTFYILSQNNSDYNNIYAIAQSLDENDNPIEYINIKSEKLQINGVTVTNDIISLNTGILVTLKNLTLDSNKSLSDIINGITISRTIFGSSNNIPEVRNYTATEIENALKTNTALQSDDGEYYSVGFNDDGEISINFKNDAYYEIYIQPKTNATENNTTTYKFQVIKQAKSSFTYFENGVEHDEVAQTPYHTEIKTPSTNIRSSLKVNFSALTEAQQDTPTPHSETLIKTYVNTYEIRFGMEQVNMQAAISATAISVAFYGVGDINVAVTFNGKTENYVLNSETNNNVLSFYEYGTYTFTMVDSMGTTTSNSFTLKQSLNTSAIVLIVLSAVILLFIIIFILRARGKVHAK